VRLSKESQVLNRLPHVDYNRIALNARQIRLPCLNLEEDPVLNFGFSEYLDRLH
jgi:hypothetical protein